MGKLSEEWNTGILEYWVLIKNRFFSHYSIIPTFHYSERSIPSFQLSTIPLYGRPLAYGEDIIAIFF